MKIVAHPGKIILVLATLVGTAGIVWAVSPHFVTSDANFSSTAGTLTCSWKEAGLGDNATISYECSADGRAIYACINKGGKHPSATNKETVAGPVSATGTFTSGKNGNITGSLTLEPPGPGAFSCPPGQKRVLGQVAYCNLDLADTTTPVDAGIAPTSVSACLSTVPGVCESPFTCP
jgi:hypothetical protein